MNLLKVIVFSEVSGKAFILAGIVAETIFRAPVYMELITIGALLIAIGSEVRVLMK